jgi:hypothetical protein
MPLNGPIRDVTPESRATATSLGRLDEGRTSGHDPNWIV